MGGNMGASEPIVNERGENRVNGSRRCSLHLDSHLVLLAAFRHNLRMSSVANVTIHESQFPENVRRDLLESLRTGEVNHKFHYDSIKQTQKWLALHRAYSPSRTDPDCATMYDRSFEGVAERIETKRAHLIGLGCGGGQKDARLLRLIRKRGKETFYTPSDVSTAMVLVARGVAMEIVPEENCHPLVCDLATAGDLAQVLEKLTAPEAIRIITFFGMIPNFEPKLILPKLSALLRSEDWLIFSANLAPGNDYAAGVRRILPSYDNELTRDWLLTFLTDLGVEIGDGETAFCIEDDRHIAELKRVAAHFRFSRKREISIEGEQFQFGPGKSIRLFFSYRHTPKLARSLLDSYGIKVVAEWIAKSEEEGVFLCKRK
jgi:uncharacterized SAM-dependent methyltransferase